MHMQPFAFGDEHDSACGGRTRRDATLQRVARGLASDHQACAVMTNFVAASLSSESTNNLYASHNAGSDSGKQ